MFIQFCLLLRPQYEKPLLSWATSTTFLDFVDPCKTQFISIHWKRKLNVWKAFGSWKMRWHPIVIVRWKHVFGIFWHTFLTCYNILKTAFWIISSSVSAVDLFKALLPKPSHKPYQILSVTWKTLWYCQKENF